MNNDRKTNNWAFYQLRLFVTYKAVLAGVPVVFVPPAYTSQTYSRCHHVHPERGKSYRNGKAFKCGHCGLEADADWNAANNIATLGCRWLLEVSSSKGSAAEGAVVNQPESSVMSCVLEGQLSLMNSTFNQG